MKKLMYILISICIMAAIWGCGEQSDGNKKVAITAGDSKVMDYEARYYAYTAQATYETYYLSINKEIDWNSKMDENVTWQYGVKCIVFDDICKREWLNQLALKEKIELNDKEKTDINTKVEDFYSKSNKKLIEKISIEKDSLLKVFEKEKLAEKAKENLEEDGSNVEEMYTKWKKGNNVTAQSKWEEIKFNSHIFTKEDLQ